MSKDNLEEKNKQLKALVNNLTEQLSDERRASHQKRNMVSGGFYMMSRKAEKNLRELARENPTASLVFSVIRENMQIGTNAVTISNAAFAKILNVSPRTIMRSTKYLSDKRYIQIIKTGGANSYVVNEQIAFSGNPNQRLAVFSSTVIAHECENEDWENVDKLKEVPVIKLSERAILTNEELPPPDQLDLDIE